MSDNLAVAWNRAALDAVRRTRMGPPRSSASRRPGRCWPSATATAPTSSATALRPAGPRRQPGRSFLLQAEEVLGDSAGLDDERKSIAEYWADGPASETPPVHWCLLAQPVSARDGHDLDDDVKLFFALSAALLDAGIACWDA